ncbi:hypothetical protein ACJJTC_012263 [Scirpophaga incertulas]
MDICLVFTVFVLYLESWKVQGNSADLQRTIENLFMDRSLVSYPGACKTIRGSKRQSKVCKRNPGLSNVLQTAKIQAINACEEAFQYDRWNCSVIFNRNPERRVFDKIYRETAFLYALMAASITHAVAKACASGELIVCSCIGSIGKAGNITWKNSGCGDDFKQGQRLTKSILDFKHAGNDQIGEALKHDVTVGIQTMNEQLREVCKCHGFSGSCTTKTCWKRLGPFSSAMGLMKKRYHHAIKRKLNSTLKRAVTSKSHNRIKLDRKELVYIQKSPNLCAKTRGRVCKDRNNCATLCCGRGYATTKKTITSRCRCKMVNCCYVQCDTCVEVVDKYICK